MALLKNIGSRILTQLIFYKKLVFGFFFFVFCLLLFHVSFPPPSEKDYSQVIYASDSTLLSAFLSTDDKWRMKTYFDELTPEMVKALVNKEDRYFYYHPGVNPFAIGRALFSNVVSGKRTSGASTITMQLARLMEPKRRTYANKVLEMFRAIQLEWNYSKKEILELYLSYLPYGGNVEGVKAASWIYYNRPPDKLSLAQCVTLAIIPNRPNSLRLDRQNDELLYSRDKWLTKFEEEKLFTEAECIQARNEPIQAKRHQLPFKAPHFSHILHRRQAKSELFTTLNPNIQEITQSLLSNYAQRVKGMGVSNGAVIVIDNKTHGVVAYCGSADFYDNQSSGQVNGITAVRSPGSALKPFAYGLGFEKGILTPGFVMDDVPVNYSGYSPENYDLKFHGPVSVSYALRQSFNIPAVKAANRVGLDDFVEFLGQGGFETIKKQKEGLGLSVVLGGCGVTLEEITRMYSIFANEGQLYPLVFLQQDSAASATQMLSPSAAWMIADILSGIERPDLPNDMLNFVDKHKVAWKTGTSYGKRDAWSIGFNPDYTIGVWMGNFSGHGAQSLSGSVMATPLLLDLFNGLPIHKREWFSEPADLYEREVCAQTGLIPSPECTQHARDHYIKTISHRKMCTLQKTTYINLDTTLQYCTACLPVEGYLKMNFPDYSPELILWFEAENRTFPKPPIHNPACKVVHSGNGPRILSPAVDFEYLLEKNSNQEILLQAAAENNIHKLYWYINGKYYKTARPNDRIFFRPTQGNVKITCMDDLGRAEEVEVLVKRY